MRQRLVIVGAGLGGCTLAQAACDDFDVTIVECGETPGEGFPRVEDAGLPAVTDPHVAGGLGGTSRLWHNGLIEIEPAVFERHWPFAKAELEPYYDRAYPLLSGGPRRSDVAAAIRQLRDKYLACGMPDGLLPGLFYPRWPLNVWKAFRLEGRVRVVHGAVQGFELAADGRVAALQTSAGRVEGDRFVLAAGGLGTPPLLQQLARHCPLPALQQAGRHYEDHPMAFVGELEVDAPLYRLWNYAPAGTGGNLRMPLVVEREGLHVSFQLRPSATVSLSSRRQRVDTLLNDLRRNPWNPLRYLQLLRHPDDVLDILSFKFGIHLPTRHYTLLMVAQMPTRDERDVWGEQDGRVVKRRWTLGDAYLATLRAAVDDVLRQLSPILRGTRLFDDWAQNLKSAAHHSGTARLSADAGQGVCDRDARVHGIANLYVCDGSLIPASGIANTGLTIAALALRLADHLRAAALPRATEA